MKLKKVLPIGYCAIALLAWLDFARLPPDGLANVALMLVVLPLTVIDLLLRPSAAQGASVLMPSSFGYYLDHAIFYGVSVLVIAVSLCWFGSWLDRRRGLRQEQDS